MIKKILTGLTLLYTCNGVAFELDIDEGMRAGSYTMISPSLVTKDQPVWNIRAYSPYLSNSMVAGACLEPGAPLKDGDYLFSARRPANPGLRKQFSESIGCAEDQVKAQLLALEAFYETEPYMDLRNGTVRFEGLSDEQATIKYCAPVDWKVLHHPVYQDIVVWNIVKPRPHNSVEYIIVHDDRPSVHTVPEPTTAVLILFGLVGMWWFHREV